MSWRVANSLGTLRCQLDDRCPGRDVTADGSIGDAAHQARGSAGDHNPWYGPGIVTARDFTHDPVHGPDIQQVADQPVDSHDPRIKYVVANRRIATHRIWQWAPYVRDRYHVNQPGSNFAARVQQADPQRSPRGY